MLAEVKETFQIELIKSIILIAIAVCSNFMLAMLRICFRKYCFLFYFRTFEKRNQTYIESNNRLHSSVDRDNYCRKLLRTFFHY